LLIFSILWTPAIKGNKKTVHDGMGNEIPGIRDSKGVLLYKKWSGTGAAGGIREAGEERAGSGIPKVAGSGRKRWK